MADEHDTWSTRARDDLVAAVAHAVGDVDVAADAVDEAFARALDRWPPVATWRAPSGWVYVVACNAARRTFRRRAMEAERLALRADPTAAADQSSVELAELLAGLAPRQQAMVALRHVDGLTEGEIADRLGVSRSTVSSTLRTAHRRLAADLRPHTPTTGGTPMDPDDMDPHAMDLQLARVRAGHDDGCDVTYLDADVSERVAYGDAVRDTIRIRRHDLVAVDVAADPPVVVWRWWHGTVDALAGAVARCTRPAASATGRATVEATVPPDLRSAVRTGDAVWFGRDGEALVVVAVAHDPGAARQALPRVAGAYDGG